MRIGDHTKRVFQVHNILEELLGDYYDPLKHWTSRHRTVMGYPPSYYDEGMRASFSFADIHGDFTKYLIQSGHNAPYEWFKKPPTYHLEVKSSEEGLEKEFTMSSAQFERVGVVAELLLLKP